MTPAATTIDSASALPPWQDVLVTIPASSGRGEVKGSEAFVLCSSGNDRHLFVVALEGCTRSPRLTAALHRFYQEGYRVEQRITVNRNVLEVVHSKWKAAHRSGGDAAITDESEAHKVWDEIVTAAHKAGASDVHMIASLGSSQFYFRVLGEVEAYGNPMTQEKGLHLASSMYNTMVDVGSTSDGFNRRAPQSASITRQYAFGSLRLRYECLPIEPDGISVTLRLVPVGMEARRKTPEELGYSPDQSESLRRIFAHSSGLVLFVGTTGSGKSTSMANMLMQMVHERPGKLLRTVEEPVEIRIPGATQTSVSRSMGGDQAFLSVLSSLMRSDPDYIMVGEIRDNATAQLAIQAVRSGHLCISTLHAGSAPMAYDRLAGLGAERSDLAAVGLVCGLVYQRLVPELCGNCKVPASEKRDQRDHADVLMRLRRCVQLRDMEPEAVLEKVYFRSDKGCRHCEFRGVTGRTVTAEILVPTRPMLSAVASGETDKIWSIWRSEIDRDHPEVMRGRTAFEHGLFKMFCGQVSPADIEREFVPLDEPEYV